MMHQHSWRPFTARLVMLLLVISVCSFSLPASPGKADASPEPWAPGNNIVPANLTQVRMVEEYVQIDLEPTNEAEPIAYRFFQSSLLAKVQANFTMKNLGTEAEDMKVYFPLGEMRSHSSSVDDLTVADFQVWVDGQPVTFEEMGIPDERWPEDRYVSAEFPVHFPTDRETDIRVTYTFGSKFVAGYGGIDSIAYIFETGAGWKGTIGKAVLEVNLLDESGPESVMHSPAGGKVNGRTITWTWNNFEPTEEDNFSMWLVGPYYWDQVQALREQLQENPQDGAAWTGLGTTYMNIALGKGGVVDFPYFFDLAKKALQKGVQLSPYDREPHYQLFQLYGSQFGMWEKQLTQAQCNQLADEVNAFLLRTAQTTDYDEKQRNIIESYEYIGCPNKPKLTEERGTFPTQTQDPKYIPTLTPTDLPGEIYMATWEPMEATREAYNEAQKLRAAKIFQITPSATASMTPLPTATATRTPTHTATSAVTAAPSATQTETPAAAVASATVAPVEMGEESPGWERWIVIGVVFVGATLLVQYFQRKRVR